MNQTDEELVESYYHGNEGALGVLFTRYKMPLFNFSLRMLGGRADAEDVTSEVFLTLFGKKYAQKPGAKFSTWLFTVARNACITQMRKRKKWLSMWFTKNDSGQFEEWDVQDEADLPRETLVKKEEAKQVRKAIDQLSGVQKEALILREYHNMKYDQISKILDCSLEQVKINIFRARQRLCVVLKEAQDG